MSFRGRSCVGGLSSASLSDKAWKKPADKTADEQQQELVSDFKQVAGSSSCAEVAVALASPFVNLRLACCDMVGQTLLVEVEGKVNECFIDVVVEPWLEQKRVEL